VWNKLCRTAPIIHVPSSNGNHGFQGDRLKKVENTKSGPLSAEPHGSSLRPILLGPLHGDLCLKGTFQKPLSLRAFASVMPLHLQLFMKQANERRENNLTSFASELFRFWDMFQRFLKPSPAHDRGSFTSPGPLSTFPVTNRHYSYQLGFDHGEITHLTQHVAGTASLRCGGFHSPVR
jgi:hypothetical protein